MRKQSNAQCRVCCPRSEEFPAALPARPVAVGSVDPTSAIGWQAILRRSTAKGVRCVREHIDANIELRISVEALAKLANLSVCNFVRVFKQSVGLTPHDYLIRRRVERTKELLSGTDLSLSEIALAAGFADQSHCARRFRQHVGMSSRDYHWSIP